MFDYNESPHLNYNAGRSRALHSRKLYNNREGRRNEATDFFYSHIDTFKGPYSDTIKHLQSRLSIALLFVDKVSSA